MDNRYQNQPWYIKVWRCRYYIPIPFRAILFWLRCTDDECSFNLCWSIEVGMAQYHMKYYYTIEEVEDRLNLPR
jgi:hypothetical protein